MVGSWAEQVLAHYALLTLEARRCAQTPAARRMYMAGAGGVVRNEAQALQLFRASAEQDHAKSLCNVGMMYEQGRGVKQNYKAAVKFYSKATVKGDPGGKAAFNLANLFKKGLGVEQAAASGGEYHVGHTRWAVAVLTIALRAVLPRLPRGASREELGASAGTPLRAALTSRPACCGPLAAGRFLELRL